MTAKIRTVKRVMTIQLSDAPLVSAASGGSMFAPYKMEIVEYKDRGKVTFTGRAVSGFKPFSTSCRLYGYNQYPDVPEWALEVMAEAGWSLNKIWNDA